MKVKYVAEVAITVDVPESAKKPSKGAIKYYVESGLAADVLDADNYLEADPVKVLSVRVRKVDMD